MPMDFDQVQLDAITGGDTEFEIEVLQEYLACAPHDVERIAIAVTAVDAPAVASAAHALKGSSATIGARGVAAIALELELAGKRGETAAMPDAFVRLEAAFHELVEMLRGRIARAA